MQVTVPLMEHFDRSDGPLPPCPGWSEALSMSDAAVKALRLSRLSWFEFLQDHDRAEMVVLRADTVAPSPGIHLRLEPASCRLLWKASETPLVIEGCEAETRFTEMAASLSPPGSTSLVVACLQQSQHLSGCLIGFPAPGRPFGPTELALFSLLANHIGLCIENTSLRAESAARLNVATGLRSVSSALVEAHNLDMTLQIIIDEAIRLTDGRDALVLLLETNGNWFTVRAREGEGLSGLKRGRLSVVDSLNGLVVQTGEPLISRDAQHDPRANKARARRLQVHSVVIAPLRIRDRTIGTIAVHNKRDGFFSQKDAALLCSFANQAAIAIDNAQLLQRLVSARNEIDQKARELQQMLVRTMNLREEERRRIAADIHDRVIPLILGATYHVEAWLPRSGQITGPASQAEGLRALLTEALDELRMAIYELWPAALEEMGLIPALREILTRHQAKTAIRYTLRVQGTAGKLDSATSIAIYRIVQEALNNAGQHASASTIDVSIRAAADCIGVTISDDGTGFDVQSVSRRPPSGHFGMIGMRERALGIGGKLRIYSRPGEGTSVMLDVPLPPCPACSAVREGG